MFRVYFLRFHSSSVFILDSASFPKKRTKKIIKKQVVSIKYKYIMRMSRSRSTVAEC